MKEATGEASMTGITIAIIAVVAVVAVPIVRMLINNTGKSACCQSQGGFYKGGKCYISEDTTGVEVEKWAEHCSDNSATKQQG